MGSFAGFGTPVEISQSRAPIHRIFTAGKDVFWLPVRVGCAQRATIRRRTPASAFVPSRHSPQGANRPVREIEPAPAPLPRGRVPSSFLISGQSALWRQPQDRQISRVSILSTFTRPLPVPRDLTLPRNRRAHRKHDRCLERAVRNPAGGADPTHRVAQIVPTRQKQQREARRALRGAGARGGHPRHRRARRARVRPLEQGRVHHHPASDCERPRAPLLRGRLHRALPHPFRRGAHQVHAKPNPQRAHGHEHLPQARVGAGHRIVQGTRRAQRPPRPQRRAEEARRGGGIRR